MTKTILWCLACAALALGLGLYLTCRDHGAYFKSTKGHLTSAQLSEARQERLFTRHTLTLHSDSGLKVDAALLVPSNEQPDRRYPVVVLLAGLDTGRHAVDYVSDIPGVMIAAIDYPYTRQDLDTAARVAKELLPLRKAALDTIPSVMLLFDYITSRADVDSSKLILIGLSMGATFVPCISAEDRRPAVAVMAFGGGDLRQIIRHNLLHFAGDFESGVLGSVGGLLLRPIEPMRYAGRISPIPLLMINGTRDGMIPRQCTDEFFQKAKPPKKLIWLDSPHIMPGNTGLTRRIVEVLKRELSLMRLVPES